VRAPARPPRRSALGVEALDSRVLLNASPLELPPPDHDFAWDVQRLATFLDPATAVPSSAAETLANVRATEAPPEDVPRDGWTPVTPDSPVTLALKTKLRSLPADLKPEVAFGDDNGDGGPEVCVRLGPSLSIFLQFAPNRDPKNPDPGEPPVHLQVLGFSLEQGGVDHLVVVEFDPPGGGDLEGLGALHLRGLRHHEEDDHSADRESSVLLTSALLTTPTGFEQAPAFAPEATGPGVPPSPPGPAALRAPGLTQSEIADIVFRADGASFDLPPGETPSRLAPLPPAATLGLPEASPDLVPLAKANLAVVPAFVAGDTERPAPVPEPSQDLDLAVTSFVIGLDEMPPARRVASAARPPEPAPEASADTPDPLGTDAPPDGERRPKASPMTDHGFACWGWLSDLIQRDDRPVVLCQALLLEAVTVLGSWRRRRTAPAAPLSR
jgi:hypothetical protein